MTESVKKLSLSSLFTSLFPSLLSFLAILTYLISTPLQAEYKKNHYYPNLWDEMRTNFELRADYKNIKPHLLWLKKNKEYFNRVAKRSARYIYYVKEELKKAGMPLDIALLPWVESAYYPFAFSPSRASGIWQFTTYTGRVYGLRQNYWYDGRRDITESTRAAIIYLKHLWKIFNKDWLVALAAYNSGEGRVRKAIEYNRRKHRPTDFFSLKLPNETKGYVPRLLAIAYMIKNSEKYQLNLPYIENKATLKSVSMNEQIDISLLAKLSDLTVEEIYTLNPGFNRWATEPNTKYKILLPIKNAKLFKKRFASYPKNSLITWIRHKIKKGDSLSQLSYQYRTNISYIKQINKLKKNTLVLGKYLIIPVAKKPSKVYVLSQLMRKRKKFNRVGNGTKIIYSVKKNESLWSIAKLYNIRVSDLVRWNNLSKRTVLQINQRLVLWYKPNTQGVRVIARVLAKNEYRVSLGDTLLKISQKFQVAIMDLAMINNMSEFDKLKPGDTLTIPVKKFSQPIIQYIVKKNDTIGKIAKKYNLKVAEIMKINNLTNQNKIKIGQKLKLIGFLSASNIASKIIPDLNFHSVSRQITYLVKTGDSLAKIASRFKVKMLDILKWNRSIKGVDIYPKQKLTIHINVTNY